MLRKKFNGMVDQYSNLEINSPFSGISRSPPSVGFLEKDEMITRTQDDFVDVVLADSRLVLALLATRSARTPPRGVVGTDVGIPDRLGDRTRRVLTRSPPFYSTTTSATSLRSLRLSSPLCSELHGVGPIAFLEAPAASEVTAEKFLSLDGFQEALVDGFLVGCAGARGLLLLRESQSVLRCAINLTSILLPGASLLA